MSDEPVIRKRSRPQTGSAMQLEVDAAVARQGRALVEQSIEASVADAEAGGGGDHRPPPADCTAVVPPRKTRKKGSGDYEVGYGKPPKQHQFRKDKSGNPKGRPKGAKNLRTEVGEIMWRPVKITRNGKSVTVPSVVVPYEQMMQKAMKGDPKSFAELHKLAVQYGMFASDEDGAPSGMARGAQLSESDMRAYATLQFDELLAAGLSNDAAHKAINVLGLGAFLSDTSAAMPEPVVSQRSSTLVEDKE